MYLTDSHAAEGIMFVVDSSDTERIPQARDEFQRLKSDPALRHLPVLLWANKQDLPGALSPREVADRMGLFRSSGFAWHVQGCQAIDGRLWDGVEYMDLMLRSPKRKKTYDVVELVPK
jgi:ADP-ribosylation factor protein 1